MPRDHKQASQKFLSKPNENHKNKKIECLEVLLEKLEA